MLSAAGVALGACASAPSDGPSAARDLNAVMDHIYDDIVLTDPQTLTQFGLDRDERAWAKSRLTDRSLIGIRERQLMLRRANTRLHAIDPSTLSKAARIDWDTLTTLYDNVVAAYDAFDYGTHSWPEPYVVSQLGGAYRQIPDFLANQHTIEAAPDCEAYLSRLADFAVQLDNETAHIEADEAIGVVAPDFVIARTLALLANVTSGPASQTVLAASLERRARERGLSGDWGAHASTIVEQAIYPAVERQAARLRAQRANASHDGGVWRLPDGEAYYAYALRYGTTTRLSAEDIHALGLERMAELTARANDILSANGMSHGTVAERIRALGRDQRFVYPNTDAGKTALIDELNAQMADMTSRLPELFRTLPRASVEIRRVPPAIEAGATGGYYQQPPLDGSRPGAYYINLRDTAEIPKWSLPTLTYHEALPGHHLQLALAQETTALHPLRRLAPFSAYTEGWALYAELLADEMGVYADDPLARLGFLNSYMMRAARLVVDTGIHAKRWSREQAIRYLMETLGNREATVVTEVERYCVWPGQATSYMVGQSRWLNARETARQRLGARFDIRAFHDRALSAGVIPLPVLERVIGAWNGA